MHIDSAVLKQKVMEKVDSLKGKVDAVLLGYAVCQSLKGVTKQLSVPTINAESEDCIGVLITPEEYEREKRTCTGTWFSSPGWAELGFDGAVKELHLDVMGKSEGYDPMYFMKMLFEEYKRASTSTPGQEKEKYVALSKDFASKLNLRYDERESDMRGVDQAEIAHVKELAEERVRQGIDRAGGRGIDRLILLRPRSILVFTSPTNSLNTADQIRTRTEPAARMSGRGR